jgi:hypothetical protein
MKIGRDYISGLPILGALVYPASPSTAGWGAYVSAPNVA